jgi:glycerophosphoryl diester phosphodiesterase
MRQLPEWITSQPIAHRGLHDSKLPENSIGAFNAAITQGYAIELDIHLSRDNRLVVLHDHTTKRLTGRDLKISEANASELTSLRLKGTQYHIPLLEDVLTAVNSKTPLLIEIKTGSPANTLCPVIQITLEGYTGEYAIQSFDPRIVGWYKKHAPNIIRGQLSYTFHDHPRMPRVFKFIMRTMLFNTLTKPDFIAYDVTALPCTAVAFWQKVSKLPLLTWTITNEVELQKARKLKANIVFERIRV